MIRTPAEIGAGLAPARRSRPIRAGERIHILGIAGAGASAAALHSAAAGAVVSGCDPGGPSPYTAALEAVCIPMAWSHDPRHITDTPRYDRIAVTKALTAVAPDHPELVAAARASIPIEPWQQLIADAAHGHDLIAVAGTHGKSTTAGWVTWLLSEAGLDPSAFVGALLPASLSGGIPATARIGRGSAFVVEADEYAGNFDPYFPSIVALTTIEWDHPDVFADRAAVLDAFGRWLRRVPDATIIANLEDRGVLDLVAKLPQDASNTGSLIGTSLVAGPSGGGEGQAGAGELVIDRRISGTIVEQAPTETVLDVEPWGDAVGLVRLQVAGRHNAANALVALATATAHASRTHAPVAPDRLLWALGSFPGIGRRLERKGEAGGVVVYDDYGHHPTAIRATLEALRQREPERRIWAVYEPLTFNRTAAMLGEFARALAEADAVAIADIWAGRDLDTTVTSSAALAAAVRREGVAATAPGTVEATAAWLGEHVQSGDAVLVMGGGHSYRIADLLLDGLRSS